MLNPKTRIKWVVILCLLSCSACGAEVDVALPTWTPIPTPVPDVLYVDAGQDLGPINPYVYGANYGPWVIVPVDLMPQAETAGVGFVRFPGGQWGDKNDLKDYHIDRFIAFCNQISAEPLINTRLPGGSPEAASELVRYTNIEKNYNVRYWAIGNEPSLYAGFYDESYDTERYNEEWRAIAEAMLAVDPDILLIGPETHQFTGNPNTDPRDASGRDWMREFLIKNGDLVDIVAIHRYPFPTSLSAPARTIADLRENSKEWDTIIPNLRKLIRETIGRDLPIAVSEISSDWSHATGGEATPDSFYNAIWWGDVLGRLIQQQVDIVAYFLLQSQSGQGGWGLLARFDVRPTYYVYQMYQQFGDELIYASSGFSEISIYAARRSDGAMTAMIINLGPDDVQVPLYLENLEITDPAEVWLFDVDHKAEHIGMQSISNGSILMLPGQSISLYVFP
ncbi:MAG: hypothetical protein ISR59_02425 [Anaerolineales bacterium]|uniref:Glycosyl hydrolases family 39 N-terminal catalytic domain-containing protein n=1 Tax=Candidatus Desulfolinea nitratireducens TaxID=2841698 RepID=A0A8J6NM65_9CHLR|nr:hypothetical protein [Candidatus Desulfolinea nitratireducens]MBL6959937.1 hypothetical protein [Anaerolineales bacterium]